MARGYPGAFGRHVNALYIWLPLCVLFILPFFNFRRPFSLLHLDLLVLLSFSVSLAFFNHAHIYASVPLVYPPLLYLLARMLALMRRGSRPEALRLLVPAPWLALGVVFLIGFRIALNVTDSNVIDVGYAGRDRGAADRPRQAALRLLSVRQRTRRHLRPGQLRGVRPVPADLRLERHLGRPARRPRRRDRVRPARGRAALPARPPRARPDAGRRPRLRLGLLPVHAVRAGEQLQRHARRRARARGAARRQLPLDARPRHAARSPRWRA